MRALWRKRVRGSALAVCGALVVVALGLAPAARAASEDPLFVFTPAPLPLQPLIPPPNGYFEGPCGLAVDSAGNFYVADYYHHAVDVFSSARTYKTQLAGLDPLDGPCGLALGAAGELYVNDYHREVAMFTPTAFPPGTGAEYAAGPAIDSAHPTGVAVDPAGGTVYVDDRTYVAAYDASGAPLLDGEGEPLRIGEGSLGDGYGVAVSAFPATAGRIYVPDAADSTVKVYDPALDVDDPIAEISGPGAGFTSLRDSAVAVDRASGDVYVADDLQPLYVESPEAAIQVFSSTGAYKGHLKYAVTDALPPGLAVDNSLTVSGGRVYVTSGNASDAGVYAYSAGAATKAPLQPPLGAGEESQGTAASSAAPQDDIAGRGEDPPAVTAAPAGARASEVSQKGTLRVALDGRLSPKALPRQGTRPIAVFFSGRISTIDGSEPPQLRRMRIELNRQGRLDQEGLPTCPAARIRTASTARALAACRAALVGQGRFWANIVLSGQEPYPTRGRLLLFNAVRHGRPAVLGQIYAAHPFATSFLIPFEIHRIGHGRYGTALSAQLPKALGSWGYITAIEMRLARRYSFHGRPHSYVSAGCPAPKGFPGAVFPLARTSFGFAGGVNVSSTLVRDCSVVGR